MIELFAKRYNTKKQYSPQSPKTFATLIDISGLPINARSLKYSAGRDLSAGAAKKTGGANQYYKSPDELVERLHLLIGSKQGGKVSVDIKNEIVTILDRLYLDGIIKKKDYQKLYSAYV